MRPVEIGLVLPMGDTFVDGATARWVDIRALALRAEELGFDTVWTADELLWRGVDVRPQGWWECPVAEMIDSGRHGAGTSASFREGGLR